MIPFDVCLRVTMAAATSIDSTFDAAVVDIIAIATATTVTDTIAIVCVFTYERDFNSSTLK